jgi:hypothetical protein
MHAVAAYLLPAAAEKPEDWDEEEDGDWEAPRIPNPKCKDAPGCGEWKRPTIPVRASSADSACLPARICLELRLACWLNMG